MEQALKLVVAPLHLSTWSLRAWLGLKTAGIPFEMERIRYSSPDFKKRVKSYSGAGQVPVLVHGPLIIHDSLAILEYINDQLAPGSLLPQEPGHRALARAYSAEMHSGFTNMRHNLPMNLLEAPHPKPLDEATQAEVNRMADIWQVLRQQKPAGGPFLFGRFSMADILFLPVATRFRTYQVSLAGHPEAQAYQETLLGLPLLAQAIQEARQALEADQASG